MDSRTIYALLPFAIAIATFWASQLVDTIGVHTVCFTILVFDVPVCLVVAWEWTRERRPPELSLSPLIPTRAERELYRNLKNRPQLSDSEFFESFYANSRVSSQSIARIRAILTEQIGMNLSGLRPNDDLTLIDGGIDWTTMIDEIEREFNIRFTDSELEAGPATFDFFVTTLLKKQPYPGFAS